MKIRKFVLGAVAVGAMFSTSLLQAQEQKKGGGRGAPTPEQAIERIETAVGPLSADQKTKIKAIYAKQAEKLQGIPQEERREKGMQIMQDTRKEVRAVLTPEQQKKYDEMPQGKGQGGKKSEK